MGYKFSGIFSDGNEHVMSAMLSQVFGVGRLIEHPFRGFGIHFDADRFAQQFAGEFPLVAWSQKFSTATFVYLYVECFGGNCAHAGFVFRSGLVVEDIAFDESDAPLRQLLRHLGIQFVGRPIFAPLQRGYFEKGVHSR